MDVSEAKRLKALEDENAKLKKLLAEQMLDAAAPSLTPDTMQRRRSQYCGPAVTRSARALLSPLNRISRSQINSLDK